MELLSTTEEQVKALINWMLDQADMPIPGPSEHAERCLSMREHAWFLREICLPKIGVQGRMANLSIAEGVNGLPQRPDGLARQNGFLRSKSTTDDREVEARDPTEGTRLVAEQVEVPTSDTGPFVASIPGATT